MTADDGGFAFILCRAFDAGDVLLDRLPNQPRSVRPRLARVTAQPIDPLEGPIVDSERNSFHIVNHSMSATSRPLPGFHVDVRRCSAGMPTRD